MTLRHGPVVTVSLQPRFVDKLCHLFWGSCWGVRPLSIAGLLTIHVEKEIKPYSISSLTNISSANMHNATFNNPEQRLFSLSISSSGVKVGMDPKLAKISLSSPLFCWLLLHSVYRARNGKTRCWRNARTWRSIGSEERSADGRYTWEYQTETKFHVYLLKTSTLLRVHFLVFSFLPSYSRLVFSYPNISLLSYMFVLLSFARELLLPVFLYRKRWKREFIETFLHRLLHWDLESWQLFYNYGWR